ncbi:MAG: hypothetical protein AB4368_05100 [Xenococcaceae cyanobacterium]
MSTLYKPRPVQSLVISSWSIASDRQIKLKRGIDALDRLKPLLMLHLEREMQFSAI